VLIIIYNFYLIHFLAFQEEEWEMNHHVVMTSSNNSSKKVICGVVITTVVMIIHKYLRIKIYTNTLNNLTNQYIRNI
jgi:hypothetical protein